MNILFSFTPARRTRLPIILSLLLALLATSAFAPLQGTPPPDAQPQVHITQVDTTHFPSVTVYVSVTDANGEPLKVNPRRLQIIENGKAINPSAVQGVGDVGALTTLLVMDVSGSMMHAQKLESAKKVAKEYIAQMRPEDRAGLISFHTQVSLVQEVTTDRDLLSKAVDSLSARGDTAMYDALIEAVRILEPLEGRKAIIVLTDGIDNRSRYSADDVINNIGSSGLSISTVGLGEYSQTTAPQWSIDEKALKDLAQRAGGFYGYAKDYRALHDIYALYSRALQSEYALTYTSPSTLRDGVRRSLTIALTSEAAQPASSSQKFDSSYNPGGLVPEVAEKNTWGLFAGLLLGLLLLLALPTLLHRFSPAFAKAAKPAGRIKLSPPPPPPRSAANNRRKPGIRLK
ncbi:MAG: VWA domain-containing protein [Anaerolineae bacterium]|nr:VWA domain-containing protein [Anaerolineae bacterium]